MKTTGLYIQMFSIHGLLRSENMELGRDADTGGQIKYVIELGKALDKVNAVNRVDLFTRMIADKAVSEDYARPVEPVNDKFRIVRIQCGGRKYIRKELLWPHMDEFVDKTIKFIKREKLAPDIVHGHYPDGGYVAMELARIFGSPFVYTGHSLGKVKEQKLLNDGLNKKEMIKRYKIDHRIAVEEEILKCANMVVTSTNQEIEEQYGIYRHGSLPYFQVIPPGIDVDKFYPFYRDMLSESERTEGAMYAKASLIQELNRFFMNPDKRLVLALCRPDKRKNIEGLVRAYGEDWELQAMANLAIFAGIRKDISMMEDNERDVLTQMLLLMNKYDLYGKMAIPKKHDFENEVPELYRIVAEKKGVFVNPALTEPFGITLLEASATGLPIVATNDGGPNDIINNCQSGILVDATDTKAIAGAIKEIITGKEKWDRFSKCGIMNVRKHYTWKAHAARYITEVRQLFQKLEPADIEVAQPSDPIGRRLMQLNHFIITDIDNTLLGGPEADVKALIKILCENYGTTGFGVATCRTIDSAVEILKTNHVPAPDVIISSVGSEIYYGPKLHYGQGWETHISSQWNREKIVNLLKVFDFLEYQEKNAQRKLKISYNMTPAKDRLATIHDLLLINKCLYNLSYSHEKYLDILPFRASKGKAIRYLSYKWEIPLQNFLVCGYSGNDGEMLRGEPKAVVVGNFSPELRKLKGMKDIYFSKNGYAAGIIEAIEKYRFLKKTNR
jgi:sucrose-phosphate synthase